jgi:hypothetical protein
MAQSTTTLELLPQTVYGTPSGNYDGSSMDFNSDRVVAASYYRVANEQTLRFDLNDFTGVIRVQASLDDDPSSDDHNWFDIYTTPEDSSAITMFGSVNVRGNFTWIRCKVTGFDGGTINSFTVVY